MWRNLVLVGERRLYLKVWVGDKPVFTPNIEEAHECAALEAITSNKRINSLGFFGIMEQVPEEK